MGTLTSANAVITLAVSDVFNTPQQLQGFSTDDVFDTPAIVAAEAVRGVDGILSGGFVYSNIVQAYMLQADSASNAVFDNWYQAQVAAQDIFYASGNAILQGIRTKWSMIRGILTSYTPVPSAGKILKPRRYEVTWQTVTPQPN